MKSIITAFIIALLWGISPVAYKLLLNDISHHTILFISGITFFIATVIYSIFNKKSIILIKIDKIIYISLISFLTLFLGTILYYIAIKHSDNISIIISITALYPLITLICSYFILCEKIHYINVIGILLIISGIIALFYK